MLRQQALPQTGRCSRAATRCSPAALRLPISRLQQGSGGCTKEHGPAAAPHPLQQLVQSQLRRAAQALLGAAAAGALLIAPPGASADQVLRFPVADKPEKTLVEVWTIVTEAFVDESFNGLAWDRELSGSLIEAAATPSASEASKQIPQLLGKLGDPFTRWVPPKEYADFRVSSDGELQGVGLLIASDPSSGRLVVLAPIRGSPAERAGIQPGDELLNVDGTSTTGWDGDMAAKHLRGPEGSGVWVKVARKREQVPGEASSRLPWEAEVQYKQFKLQRQRLELSPVFATAMHFDDHTFGYVRLVTFSAHAAEEVNRAIQQLEKDGAEAFILDLRNNPGGLVKASLDVAGLWLDGSEHPTVFNVMDRNAGVQQVGLEQGVAATHAPLVVLVNKQSASASEILAGALHDNGRAEVIGEPTFGKGKIQSVFELGDGSALFVTVAKYTTPGGSEIDKVGVRPDRACAPLGVGSPASIPGIPVGPGADQRVIDELGTDDCVLTAELLLERAAERGYQPAAAPELVARSPSL